MSETQQRRLARTMILGERQYDAGHPVMVLGVSREKCQIEIDGRDFAVKQGDLIGGYTLQSDDVASNQTPAATQYEYEVVSVKGGKFHRPDNKLFDSGGKAFRDARLMRCGRSLVPLNFFETVADADKYTGGRLESHICQQCEQKVSYLWRVPEVLRNGNPQPSVTDSNSERSDSAVATPRPWAHSGAVVFCKSMMPAHGMFEEQPAIAACSPDTARTSAFITAPHYDVEDANAIHEANAALIVQAVNSFDALCEVLATAESLNSLQHAGISAEEMTEVWADLYAQCQKARAALAEGKDAR